MSSETQGPPRSSPRQLGLHCLGETKKTPPRCPGRGNSRQSKQGKQRTFCHKGYRGGEKHKGLLWEVTEMQTQSLSAWQESPARTAQGMLFHKLDHSRCWGKTRSRATQDQSYNAKGGKGERWKGRGEQKQQEMGAAGFTITSHISRMSSATPSRSVTTSLWTARSSGTFSF